MEVLSHSIDEVLVQILPGGRVSWVFFLHYRDQFVGDLIDFITCKEVGDFAGGQDVVDELKECLVFNFVVSKQERYT